MSELQKSSVGSNPTLTANIKYPMDYSRIMCVGEGRQIEAVLTLNATKMIEPAPSITYAVTCWRPDRALDLFMSAGLREELSGKVEFVFEKEYEIHDPMLSFYRSNHWFYQQALKFTAMGVIDADAFLIQDCDVVPIKPYHPFIGGIPNVRVEQIINHYQDIYVREATSFLGIEKTYDKSYVSELFPYLKKDYLSLKEHIKHKHGKDLLAALASQGPMAIDSLKWLSEYEILGIWKDHIDPTWTREEQDFVNLDFRPSVVKFRTRPSKFMTIDDAPRAIEMINRLTKSFG